jgi:flagellum-specific peptidoglycan hydrolase FlgJ
MACAGICLIAFSLGVCANNYRTEVFKLNGKYNELAMSIGQTTKEMNLITAENINLKRSEAITPFALMSINDTINNILDTCNTSFERKFIKEIMPFAIKFQIDRNIPASAMISQAIYESNYGRSALAKTNYNFFGLKAPKKGNIPYSMMPTTDCGVYHEQPFRKFENIYEGFCGYYEFLSSKNIYNNAFKQTDGESFIKSLLSAGYCPNSNYLGEIHQVMTRHHLSKLDDIVKESGNKFFIISSKTVK